MSLLAIGLVAFAVTLVTTPLVMRLARHWEIVDRPGSLKPQARAVPYLGGVAVFAGAVVGTAAGHLAALIPLIVALVIGVADDRFDLPPVVRLCGQLAVGIAIVLVCPVHLPGAVGAILIVAVTLLVVNGVNLIDGLDLLAGGVVAVGGVGFAIATHGAGRQLAVALALALAAFLVYNRPPARVYLGDGGSYLLGAAMTVLLAESWAPGVPVPTGIAVLALVAVPAAEVAFAVVRRSRSSRSILAGDRGHPYDRLVSRGWARPVASLAYIAVEALLAAGVVLTVHLGTSAGAIVLDLAAAALLVVLAGVTGALTPDVEVAP